MTKTWTQKALGNFFSFFNASLSSTPPHIFLLSCSSQDTSAGGLLLARPAIRNWKETLRMTESVRRGREVISSYAATDSRSQGTK